VLVSRQRLGQDDGHGQGHQEPRTRPTDGMDHGGKGTFKWCWPAAESSRRGDHDTSPARQTSHGDACTLSAHAPLSLCIVVGGRRASSAHIL
jgi:hypothetical protein